jgi:transposase
MTKLEATGVTAVRDRRALQGTDMALAKRRRRYPLEEKLAILEAAAEPGARVSEVSRRCGVGRGVIHNWRRQQAVAALGATMRFTPVSVAPAKVPSTIGAIEIELVDGVRLRVDAGVDEAALGRVLRALGR